MIDSSSIMQLKSGRAKEYIWIFQPIPKTHRIEHFYKIGTIILFVTETIIPNLFPPNSPKGCHALNMTVIPNEESGEVMHVV